MYLILRATTESTTPYVLGGLVREYDLTYIVLTAKLQMRET